MRSGKKRGFIPSRERLTKPAYLLIRLGMTLSCLILAGCLLYGVYIGELNAHSVALHRLLADIYRLPLGILPVTALGALIAEDAVR